MYQAKLLADRPSPTEMLIDELFVTFPSANVEELFKTVFIWFFVPVERSHIKRVRWEARQAHELFLKAGMVPGFFSRVPHLHAKIAAYADSPFQGRHNVENPESLMKEALDKATMEVRNLLPSLYALNDAPFFWKRVYFHYFGRHPEGDNDAHWDTLFRVGMPALRART